MAHNQTIAALIGKWGRLTTFAGLLLAGSLLVVFRSAIAADANAAAKVKWNYGPETNGLCAAVDWQENQEFTGGQVVSLHFHLRNVSSHDIQISTSNPKMGIGVDVLYVEPEAGQTKLFSLPWCTGIAEPRRIILQPGKEVELDGASVAILASPGDAAIANSPCGYSATVAPGQYTAHFQLDFRYTGIRGELPTDWRGNVETGTVKINVKAGAIAVK